MFPIYTKMETKSAESAEKVPIQNNKKKYYCEKCDYSTCHLSHWKKHISTKKHVSKRFQNVSKMETQKVPKSTIKKYCCPNCDKVYKSRSGLYKHSQTCVEIVIQEEEETENQIVTTEDQTFMTTCMQTMMAMMKEMQAEKEERMKLQDQICKQQEQMSELIPKVGNNNNNRININVFLNENCKDAINMSEFLEGIKVQLQDLEYVKNNSLQDGISQIFVNELKQLDTCKRPIHCTDVKRETLYIKDEGDWSKDQHREKLQQGFRDVAHQYRKAISEWEEKNPNWNTNEKLRDEYISLVQKTYKDTYGASENKIIKKIAKETQIDTSSLTVED